MCKLVSLVLENNIPNEKYKFFLEKFAMEFKKILNVDLQNQLAVTEFCIKPTKRTCDCNSGLGSKLMTGEAEKFDDNYFINLGVSKEYLDELKQEISIDENNQKKDTDRWLLFIKEFLENFKLNKVGVLLHYYSGDMGTEKIKIHEKLYVNLNEITTETLSNLQYDKIYYFTS